MTVDTEVTTHQVALSFEDGVTRFITCRADQTVADASYRQRINIPLDCRDGACGTCKALCESGDYDSGTYIDDALSADEAGQGYVLPCSMRPRSDLVLQIASTSEIAKTQAARFASTVVGLRRLSATTVELTVEIPDRGQLVFLPGQYVNIAVPGTEVTRSYSFSNAPHEDQLSFLIKITPGGAMSTYLTTRARVGDELSFTGPHGSFFLRDSERPVLLLAGGTGVAPILSMLRTLRAEASTRTAHLLYGVGTDEDLVALEQITQVATDLPGLTWDHCVSDPASTAVNKGYVMSFLRPEHLNDGNVAVYLCGPPPMVEAARDHLTRTGIEPTGFYYEKFALAAPGGIAHVGDAESAAAEPVRLVPAAEILLEATDARAVAGQVVLPAVDIAAWADPVPVSDPGDAVRRIAGQLMIPAAPNTEDPASGIDAETGLIVSGGRSITGQEVFAAAWSRTTPSAAEPARLPTVATSAIAPTTAPDGYQIGEEHPDVQSSDALFEARQALELAALELTVGRLGSQQLSGYRLLAESTLPYVSGERFTDAAAYTESNAAFHDYLFTLTRNAHLLQAYQALGVKGRMAEVLRNATWCHPQCATDHVEIVEAFEANDRDRARALVTAHAQRSKQTMRRAMTDAAEANRPRFVTPGRFNGKVVVVTGAAQGIGAQVARRVAAEGGTLVVADRSELVGELAQELVAHGDVAPVICDLETWAGAQTLISRAVERYGRVDVLINNVGGAINFKPFTEFTHQEIGAEINRSLMTTMLACRAVLPGMVERRGGTIVNVSSVATRGIHRIPYSAAKGGVNALTASLAVEYAADGIRVVATAPGGTEAPPRRISRGTPSLRDDRERTWFQAHIDQTIQSSLLHRYGTLDEQAAAITFLASDEASYITGTVLPVAGGDLG